MPDGDDHTVVFTPSATTNGKAGSYAPGLCICDSFMRFVWDEAKPLSNLRDHEIDFVYAQQVPIRPQLLTAPKRSRSWTIDCSLGSEFRIAISKTRQGLALVREV